MQNDRDDSVPKLATRLLRHPVILASTSLALVAVIALAWAASAFADNGTCDVYVANNTLSKTCTTNTGAIVSYLGAQDTSADNTASSGTGTFNSFVRIQGSPTEQGYNTDATGQGIQFDTKSGAWTHSILVSQIPVVTNVPGHIGTPYWELFADINENNSSTTTPISLNKLEVYFTSDPAITGYNSGTQTFSSSASTLEYAFNGDILINDVNAGSGRADLRYRIPTTGITIPANCGYGDAGCTTYFVLYTQWGTSTLQPAPSGAITGATYNSDGGFEEWKTKVYPTLQIVKNTVGGDATFGYTVTGPSAPLSPATNITTSGGTGHTILYIVDPGTYTITESSKPTGWVETGAVCSLNGGTATTYTDGANILIGSTDHVVCTYTNTAPGTIIVRKQTIGGTGSFTFTGTGDHGLPASITLSTAAQSTYVSQTFTGVTPGTYQVAETVPSGWDLTAADCGGTPAASNPAAFTLAAGGTVTCSFTDTLRGTIIVQKQTIGGTGSFVFTGTGDHGLPASITLSTAAVLTYVGQTFTNMVPGTYQVAETIPSGWDLTAADCGGSPAAANPAAFTLAPGETVTCQFTDTKEGTIIVRKQTIGGTGSFVFTGTGGSTLPASITLSTAAQSTYVSQTFTNVIPGTYQVGETVPTGWDLTAADCGGSNSAPSSPPSFLVAAGATVTCSFTDTKEGTIIVRKQTIGGTGSFVFTGTGGSNLPASITLSTAAQTTYVSQTFTNMLPGTYSVAETVPTGWDLTAADCGGSNSAPSSPAAFNLAPGATVTCSFTDTKESQIIVRKQTIGGTGSFVFTGTGGSNLPASITLSTASQSTYVSQTFNNMLPGTYQVGETVPSGWDLTAADCGGTPAASNPAAFTLAPGATVTCSFTDTMRGTIIVQKQTIGGTGQFTFTGTGGSNLPAGITLSTASQSTYVSQTFTNVLPGTYSVGEDGPPSGWDLTASSCTTGAPAGFTLVPGGTVTCSFTDTLRGTIIVRKQTIGGTGQFTFTGTGGSNLPASITLSTAAQTTYVSQTFTNVVPGTYQVGETVPSGWDLTAANCGGTPAASNPAAFTLAPGATVTCSFTDTMRGTIIVQKQTIGGTGQFTFTGTGGSNLPAGITLSTASQSTYVSQTFTNVLPGTYQVGENLPVTGWDLTAADCGGTPAASNPAAFTLAPGATVTCSFTDTKEGTIIVRKQTIGGTGSFVFTGTGGSNLPASITLSTASQSTYVSQTFTNVLPGTYQVGETVPSGWDLTAADCGGTPAASNPAAFTLAPGATVTCSFTDTLRGKIIIVKQTTGGNGTFTFPTTSSTDTTLPLTITITTVSGSGTFTSDPLKSGTYTVTENFQTGWVFTGVSCAVVTGHEGAGGSTVPAASQTDPSVSLGLAPGAWIQCTYANSAPSTTRTQGFWATHLALTLKVWNGGTIGGNTFPTTTDAQRTLCTSGPTQLLTPLSDAELMGGFWANISKTTTGDKRSSLNQARMQLLQQLLAAILNNYAFGSAPTGSISIADATAAFCTGTLQQVKDAAAAMAYFNTQGDSGAFTPGVAANGKEAKDFADIAFWDFLGK